MVRFFFFLLVLMFSSYALLPACTRMTTNHSVLSSASPWEGELKTLFDDSIDPSALGFGSSTSQRLIHARAEKAQFILRSRVTTVSTEGAGDDIRFFIALRVDEEPVAGPRPTTDTINIIIDRYAPSFPLVQNADIGLTGTQFIAFLRDFDENGTRALHWHMAPDTPQVAEVIRNAFLLSEVKKD